MTGLLATGFVLRSGFEYQPDRRKINPMLSSIKMLLTLTALVAAPLLLSTVFASAQSFNCAKANTKAEFAICNNEDLLSLDEQMAAVFHIQRSKLPSSSDRQKASQVQTKWLKKRNSCNLDWQCLQVQYNDRIVEIQTKL